MNLRVKKPRKLWLIRKDGTHASTWEVHADKLVAEMRWNQFKADDYLETIEITPEVRAALKKEKLI